jgi:hypothetical protein
MKVKKILATILLSNTLLLVSCMVNKIETSIDTTKYNVESNLKEGITFAQEIIYNQFYSNISESSNWEDLDVFYKKTIKLYANDKQLGFLKQSILEILFIERTSKNGKYLFQYANTLKHNEAIDFYAKEFLSLTYQNPTIAINMAKSLEQVWGKEKTNTYLKNIAIKNETKYAQQKKSFTSDNFDDTGLSSKVKKQLFSAIQEDLLALETIQKYNSK